ncbi:hypothetical protein AB0F85_26040 [Nocardia fluminea]
MDEALQFLSDNYNAIAGLGLYVLQTGFEITAPLTLLILNFLNS